jgi:hypothetical protein
MMGRCLRTKLLEEYLDRKRIWELWFHGDECNKTAQSGTQSLYGHMKRVAEDCGRENRREV